MADKDKCLNKSNEFVSKCRHLNKFKIKNVKGMEDMDLLKHTANVSEHEGNLNAKDLDNELSKVRRSRRNMQKDCITKPCSVALERINIQDCSKPCHVILKRIDDSTSSTAKTNASTRRTRRKNPRYFGEEWFK